MKFFVCSFNRASDGAISKLVKKLKEKDMYATNTDESDYIIAVGDRTETFDKVYHQFKQGKSIIHLWSGEQSCWTTNDDVWRHSIMLMSMTQLCTNPTALQKVKELCKVVGKKPNAHIVGNVMLDNLDIDRTVKARWKDFDIVLYNPPSNLSDNEILAEIDSINNSLGENYYWIETNGDKKSELVEPYVNTKSLPRPVFLGLLEKCRKFITNSSCQFYEAPFVMNRCNIISIGKRNAQRESKYADMTITGSTDKIIKILEEMK